MDNYTELKAQIASWLMRSDLEGAIPAFIALAEAEFNRRLRTSDMLVTADALLDAERLALPGDFLQMRTIYLADERPKVSLEFLTPDALIKADNRFAAQGRPVYYTTVGRELRTLPATEAGRPIEMVYYGRIPKLSTADPENWLLSLHPDLYLYGALMHSAPFLEDDERLQVWGTLKEQALEQANLQAERTQYSSGSLNAQTQRVF